MSGEFGQFFVYVMSGGKLNYREADNITGTWDFQKKKEEVLRYVKPVANTLERNIPTDR